MAKRTPTKTAVMMQSWDDWFENCGAMVNPLISYEDAMWEYYGYHLNPKNNDMIYQDYAVHHASGFYKEKMRFPSWQIPSVLLKGIIGLAVGLIIMLIAGLIKGGGMNNTAVTFAAVGCVIGLLLGITVGVVLSKRKLSRYISKMEEAEEKLRMRIQYLPPKYRNSIAVKFLYDTYLNYPGVITYNTAIQELDSYLGQLPRNSGEYIGKLIAVMFDVPLEHTGLEGDAEDDSGPQLYKTDSNNPAMANPNLPKDIVNRTFEGVDDADEKLNELIGLKDVKKQISQMKNRMRFYSSTGGRAEKISGNHMCFLGSPGTGKTTVARIITRILYDFGYIRENKCVEVEGGYFKSPYVGETTLKTQAIIDYAMGGVLFIDEAYLMMDKNGTAGTEATGTLLKNMEDHQNDFVVIFAGYEDAVNRLLGTNEGFASRIKYKVYFKDFTLEELMQIFDLDMKTYSKNGAYSIEPKARKMLEKHFDIERDSAVFGNARVVRNALDMILDVHADNFMNGKLEKDKKFVFTVADVKEYIDTRNGQLEEDNRNYIASQNLDNQIISFAELKGRTKEGSSDPDKDLNALTGLSVVKDEIEKMKAQFAFYDGKMGNTEGHHMCFMGPPGTGKSTVAGIMTAYLYKMGIIRRNEFLDINGDFLRGMYLGHTGKRTQAVINYCQGMVLFVDEAYLLQQDNNMGDNFGQEAIGVLLDAMEKHRKNFVVIFAGYDKEMNAFLNANSGLRSRISMMFHFQSYTAHELAQMMQRFAKNDKFTVEKAVWLPLQRYLKTRLDEPHFGNGRFIRSFWQAVKQSHIMNYARMNDESKKYVISLEDVEAVFDMNIQAEEKEKIPSPPDFPDLDLPQQDVYNVDPNSYMNSEPLQADVYQEGY